MTVNHFIEFKNSETGAHTNTIEELKRNFLDRRKTERKTTSSIIFVFILKKWWKDKNDSFFKFMEPAANSYANSDVILPSNLAEFIEEDVVFQSLNNVE